MKKQRQRKSKAQKSYKSIMSRVRKMSAPEPMKPRKGRFIDYVFDMYELPDQVELRHVNNGPAGVRQDAVNLRSYFNTARSKFLADSE